jgi:hypothetical protein
MEFSIYVVLPATLQSWTQPLTDISTRNLLGGKGQQACKAGNLHCHILSQFSGKCGSLDVSKPYEPPWPAKGTAFLKGHWKGHFISFQMSLQ